MGEEEEGEERRGEKGKLMVKKGGGKKGSGRKEKLQSKETKRRRNPKEYERDTARGRREIEKHDKIILHLPCI